MAEDLALQLDLAIRLVTAAVFGAMIGLEREIHDHPAGMRTHLLVSVGSAAFTVLSIYGFPAVGADPARIAAQIVTGVGFLGAGAILKEGATIRGLTTAASLWAVAAVGMAAGAGAWGVAIAITFIVIVSLWPLRVITARFVGRAPHRVRLTIFAADAHKIGQIVEAVTAHDGSVAHLATRVARTGGLTVDLESRAPDAQKGAAMTAAIGDLDGVDLIESTALGD